MASERRQQPPTSTAGDRALGLARAIVGDVMPFGGTLAELASWFMRSPLERRSEEWQRQVGEVLHSLENERSLTLETLRGDDAFIDTVLQATHVAMRNAQEDKRKALRNAILNAAGPLAPLQAKREMFLRYVDELTLWHLRLLDLYSDPVRWYARHGVAWPNLAAGARSQIVARAFPDLMADSSFAQQVWRDLYGRGLVSAESLSGTISEHGLQQALLTASGREFLAFISEPVSASE